MFYTDNGIVIISRSPGESLNFYYKKSNAIINLINQSTNYLTETQVNIIYNKAAKEISTSTLECTYY
jgi:hypothetical protein